MDPASLTCEKCGTRLQVPKDHTTQTFCPSCGTAATPKVEILQAANDSVEVVVDAPVLKECPFCGELIRVRALKCRYCGEFLDDAPVPRSSSGAGSVSRSRLNFTHILLSTVLFPIGLCIGIVLAIRRERTGMTMIQASILSLIIVLAGGLAYRFHRSRTGNQPAGPQEIDSPRAENRSVTPFDPVGQASPFGDTDIDLMGQPPLIRRALLANVQIEMTDPTRRGLGSGIVIQRRGEDALIVTNRHVVDGNFAYWNLPTPIQDIFKPSVTYLTKEKCSGTVVWVAPDTIDLAIVQAPCSAEIEPVPWASVRRAAIGEEVFAIGNPASLGWTLSRGIVSQIRTKKSGSYDVPIIQTDASLSPGNSGGGLYNAQGELIGINSAIVTPMLANRLGFAIRTDILRDLAPDVLDRSPEEGEP